MMLKVNLIHLKAKPDEDLPRRKIQFTTTTYITSARGYGSINMSSHFPLELTPVYRFLTIGPILPWRQH